MFSFLQKITIHFFFSRNPMLKPDVLDCLDLLVRVLTAAQIKFVKLQLLSLAPCCQIYKVTDEA